MGRVAGGLRTPILWFATACSIVTGYVLLARGGNTVPAALLVLGYVFLAPLAIAGPAAAPVDARSRDVPPYRWAALVALAILALYVATLAPGTAMWDTSEYMAAAKALGIPHPPGNPLFVLVAYLFGTLPIAATFAVRVNLLAATASAASAGLWFLIAHEATRRCFTARWAQVAAAAACTMLGATSFTVWNQSVVNEKVYTLSLLQLTVVVWLALRWTRRPAGKEADRLLLVIAYLLALGYTIHPAGYLAGPCVLAAVLLVAPKTLLRARMVALVAGVTALGLSLFAFEPIRSANHPTLNEGEPTACTAGFALNCTLSLDTLARLRAQLTREQYLKPDLSDRQASFGAQLGMWWLYYNWQWFRDPHGAHPSAQIALALLAVALAVIGARTHARLDRDAFVMLAALLFTLTVALIFYLNFKYGYSQSPELGAGVPREVRDRDYFFLWSFSCLGVWTGLGLATCWRSIAGLVRGPRAMARSAPVLAFALIPFALNFHAASRAGQTFTREWARDLLDSVAPDGILITNGDNDTFPLWYAQEVEHYRRDVVVIVSSYLGTDWFPKQLMRRGVALAASPEEADSVPQMVQIATPQLFQAGAIRATIPAGYLSREQLFVLRMVRDVLPSRPLFFTNPGTPQALGLASYLVSDGLVVQLKDAPVTESADVVRTRAGFVDVTRLLALWRGSFHGVAAFEAQGDWIDPASIMMPGEYVMAGSILADALQARGDSAQAASVEAEVERMLGIAGLATALGIAQ